MTRKSCKTEIDDIEDRINEQERLAGFTYTDEQRSAIELATKENVLAINGKGGTGKTTILKGIIGVLDKFSYMSCALSGKASMVIASQGLESMTIHRMLGVEPTGGFFFNAERRLPYDIVIIDESSMVNNYLVYCIVTALKDDAKLIFVGDNGQLPSIGTGAIFDSILNSGEGVIPNQELTKVHRQAAKSGILDVANEIRDGYHVTEQYNYDRETFGELRDMSIIPVDRDTDIVDMVLSIAERNKHKDVYDFQILTGLRERGDLSVKNLNYSLQEIFNDIEKPFIKRGGYEYREGDKVIHNGNNYTAGAEENVKIFNGTMGKIKEIEFDPDNSKQNHLVHIEFEGIKEIIIYGMKEMEQVDLAYAITTHKSQGSSIKNVVFAFDFSSYMLLSREFVYTGITRASKGCIMIADNGALHYAIENSIKGTRRDFLSDMLIEERIRRDKAKENIEF